MKLSELKTALNYLEKIHFVLPNGKNVPAHFHITEVGKVSKHFMDCGGSERMEEVISLQLWQSIDYHHRLKPSKLLNIFNLSEQKLQLQDSEVEVEYQADTIGKYGIQFRDGQFHLTAKNTACLAEEACGIPANKEKVKTKLSSLTDGSCCSPESGCC